MRLVKWQPFNELVSLQDELNRAFASSFSSEEEIKSWNPSIDLSETKDSYKIKADIPGLGKEDIDISFEDKTLTIKGERKDTVVEEGENIYKKEISYGSFQKKIFLSQDVESDNIKALYVNGVLDLTIPKAERTKIKKIVLQ